MGSIAMEQNTEVLRELKALRAAVDTLTAAIAHSTRLGTAGDPPAPRLAADDGLKARVKAYFEEHDGETLYPDDVAEALDLDLLTAIEICESLVREGRLARDHV